MLHHFIYYIYIFCRPLLMISGWLSAAVNDTPFNCVINNDLAPHENADANNSRNYRFLPAERSNKKKLQPPRVRCLLLVSLVISNIFSTKQQPQFEVEVRAFSEWLPFRYWLNLWRKKEHLVGLRMIRADD